MSSSTVKYCDVVLHSLTLRPQVKIADFGLATRLTGRPNERHVTMCGTPNYISPEVCIFNDIPNNRLVKFVIQLSDKGKLGVMADKLAHYFGYKST